MFVLKSTRSFFQNNLCRHVGADGSGTSVSNNFFPGGTLIPWVYPLGPKMIEIRRVIYQFCRVMML